MKFIRRRRGIRRIVQLQRVGWIKIKMANICLLAKPFATFSHRASSGFHRVLLCHAEVQRIDFYLNVYVKIKSL